VKGFTPFFVSIDKADQERSSADLFMQPLHHLNILRNETRLEEEVLRRIARNREFRHEDEVSSGSIETLVGLQDFVGITLEISDRRIDLSETNFHTSQADYALVQPEQWLLLA
jgi:hypothetical protein